MTSLVGYDYRLPADAVHHGLPSTSATVVIALDEPLDCGWLDDEAKRYLSLDQALVLGSLGNVLGRSALRRAFAVGDAVRIRGVIPPETFGS